MIIWELGTSLNYLAFMHVDERGVRVWLDYIDGKLARWKPVRISYSTDVFDDTDERHERVPDFPSLGSLITCDDKAKSVLEGMLEGYAEFLPLISDEKVGKPYYILHPTRELNCEDWARSDWERAFRGSTIRSVRRFAFIQNRIGDAPMFILPGSTPFKPFVTDRFKQLVEDKNLTGLEFRNRGDARRYSYFQRVVAYCRGFICRKIFYYTSRFSRRR